MNTDARASVELDTSDTRYRRIGAVILFLVFVVFGGWAAFAPLDSAALAPGVVTVKNYRKTLQHLEGGIVDDILVREGDAVKAGDALIVLDATQYRAESEVLRGQYIALRALESRLLAERDGLAEVVYAPDFLALEDPRVAAAMASQDEIFNARMSANAGERQVLEQRVEQLQSQIAGVEAVRDSNARLLASYESEMKDLQSLQERGFTGKQRLTEVQRAYASLVGENAEALSEIAANRIRIGETQLQIIQLERYQRSEVVDELEGIQSKLFDVNERLRAVEDKVARAVIRAPVSGVVLGMTVHTVGGVVRPGTPLMDIVPEQQQLMVDAQISPMDIDRVQTGVRARIRFSAFKSATTPIAEGNVVSISADRLVNTSSGEPYYLAQVEVDPDSMARMAGLRLVPGMPAEVLINTGSRTLLQYLMQPASNVMARSFIED
ncbi:HlyD family type I secretion periplasmic adaptor subunit [Parahaliea aestuarii]|uniref:Membrane fusion protein (MFP) family protein n=1 Tax=Parahaliea aestuarii TaxID=1852021 RepID=A0A5C9A0Z0_9GAMM|nr:HlyD family type I secretion periplasmic adaptor subunit [Parahaliea aestuarii]TXS93552.1 HlyD family type I secretion periplasmic adaptor subunit [Parahaliea aestuarii]